MENNIQKILPTCHIFSFEENHGKKAKHARSPTNPLNHIVTFRISILPIHAKTAVIHLARMPLSAPIVERQNMHPIRKTKRK